MTSTPTPFSPQEVGTSIMSLIAPQGSSEFRDAQSIPNVDEIISILAADKSEFKQFLSNIEGDETILAAFRSTLDVVRSNLVAATTIDGAAKMAVLDAAKSRLIAFVEEYGSRIREVLTQNSAFAETIELFSGESEAFEMTPHLPQKYISSHKPKDYPKQGWIHCGMYCVKNILCALGRDIHDDPRNYHISKFSRLQGKNMPDELAKILRINNIDANVKTAEMPNDQERLGILKEEISKDQPVILRVNNGYMRSGKYSALQSHFLKYIASHWITIYGYDDQKECFYIYDPYIDQTKIKDPPPIGNIARSYEDVLRDWKRALLTWPKRYVYIPCSYSKSKS